MSDPGRQHGFWSRLVTNAAVVALASVIAFTLGWWTEREKLKNEYNKLENERDKAKIEIVNLIKGNQTELVDYLLLYYDCKYGDPDRDPDYHTLLISFSDFIASARGPLADIPPIANPEAVGISTRSIKAELWSANRRNYVEYLAKLYDRVDSTDKKEIVDQLLGSIIKVDNEKEVDRRYRTNLYIALAFSKLPPNAISDKDIKRFQLLKNDPYYSLDSTFRRNVDNAFAQQNVSEGPPTDSSAGTRLGGAQQNTQRSDPSVQLGGEKKSVDKLCDFIRSQAKSKIQTQTSWWHYIPWPRK